MRYLLTAFVCVLLWLEVALAQNPSSASSKPAVSYTIGVASVNQQLSGPVATINWSTTYQTMDGFGASNIGQGNAANAYDSIAFQTLGLSLLRTSVPDDGSCTSVGYACANGGGGGNVTDMQACVANGCRVWTTGFDPTAAYSTNGSTNCVDNRGGGTLSSAHYQDYANYLSNYIASVQQYYGIRLYAVSPQNEPNVCESYGSSLWPDWLFDTFIRDYLGPTLQANGQSSTFIMCCEDDPNVADFTDICMKDSACASYVKGNDYHNYKNVTTSNAYGVPHFWQTETGGFTWGGPNASGCTQGDWCPTIADGMMWAGIYDRDIVTSGVTGWDYFRITAAVGDNTNGDLINNSTGEVSIRAYMLGNYSKYVRPGWVRIDATHAPQSGVTVTAYKSGSSFAIVATNQNTSAVGQSFTFNGVSPSSATPTITSATQMLQSLTPVSISGGSFSYSLPAQSVITFHNP
jgi:glucuronoarabinoxylan endo-1,4-beta-xylanase